MRVGVAATVAALTLGLAGCGNEDAAPPRSALVEQLAHLCDETRLAVEELGEPRDEGAAVFRPWSRVGLRFVADVRRLPATTARQRKQVSLLATYFKGFYQSLEQGYDLHGAGDSQAVKMGLQRGYALLASAEQLAEAMGAPECTERPFEAT